MPPNSRYYRHGRFAIPADSGAALDFYLRRLLVPHSRREMLLAPLARQSNIFGRLLFTNTGGNIDFENASDGGLNASLVSPAQVLIERLEASGVKVSGADVKLLLLGDYFHSARAQSVVFVFDGSATTPVAVAKISSAARAEALEKEFQTLENLTQSLPSKLAPTVPKPFELFTDSGFSVLLESALPGSSVHFEMRNDWKPRRLVEKHFSLALSWLADFHRATLTRKIRFEELRREEFASCFEKLRRTCRTSPAEDDFIGELMAAAAVFDKEEIPLSAVQGDFWTRNILIDGEKIGVVDWEHSLTEGCSLDDALMFAISYGRGYQWEFGRWAAPREAFIRTFYGKSRFSETVGAHMEKFCRELGITTKLLGTFMAVFLARQAVAETLLNRRRDLGSENEQASLTKEKEVTQWRSLFREYAGAAKKNACFG